MSVHFALATAGKDLRRRFADPVGLLIWLALPVAIGGLLALIHGGDGGTPHGRLLLADEDHSFVSALIGEIPRQGELGELFDLERVEQSEGRRLVDAGEASALIILPTGLQDAFAGKGSAEIQLLVHPAQRILPALIEETLEIVADSAFYTARLFGDLSHRFSELRPGDLPDLWPGGDPALPPGSGERPNEWAEWFDSLLPANGDLRLAPPALRVEYAPAPDTADAGRAGGLIDLGRIFLPGMIFLSLLFIAQGQSGDVWNEKRLGTQHRAALSPPSMTAFLAGKLLAGASITGMAALVGVGAALLFFELPLRLAPLAVLWIAFSGSVMVIYFVLLHLFASNQRAGDMISNIVMFPALMLGGSFFPFELMPEWMAAIGRWTPNGTALVRLKEILDAQPDYGALFGAALSIGTPAAAAFAISVRRMQGRFLAC